MKEKFLDFFNFCTPGSVTGPELTMRIRIMPTKINAEQCGSGSIRNTAFNRPYNSDQNKITDKD